MKDSYVFYRSYYEAITELPDNEQLKLFKAITEFGLNNEEIKLDGISKVLFTLIKPNIKSSNARYQASIENGKRGGNPNFKKGQRNPYYTQKDNPKDNLADNPINNLNEDEDYNDNYNVNINESESSVEITDEITPSFSHTSTPALSDIIAYGNSLGANSDYCERFYNHYESIGWVNANGIKIKNWKLTLNNWYKKDLESGKIKIDNRRRLG